MVSGAKDINLGFPIEYKAIVIGFLIMATIILLLLKNKFTAKGAANKLVRRKAFLQLTAKQSFQVLIYNNLEYVLLVSQDNVSLVNKIDVKKDSKYLKVAENL